MTSPGIKDDFRTGTKAIFYSSPVLDFRTGTKDSICLGFKHSRDKCVGTKTCFVVVSLAVLASSLELARVHCTATWPQITRVTGRAGLIEGAAMFSVFQQRKLSI